MPFLAFGFSPADRFPIRRQDQTRTGIGNLNPVAARFATIYHERAAKAGVPYTNVDTQAAGSYAAWQMLEAAVTATKSLEDKVLAQWLRKNQVQTIVGRFRFDGTNNYGDDLSKVKQVQDGKWVVVWPKDFAAPGARLLPQ